MSSWFEYGLRWVALLATLLTVQSIAEEPSKVTFSIGGVRIGADSSELAWLGEPTVHRTGDAMAPEWRFKSGLVVLFWADDDTVAQIETRAPTVCTDTGVCPGMPAVRVMELLGRDLKGEYPSDGEHPYAATYDTCWLEVVMRDERVESITIACQP